MHEFSIIQSLIELVRRHVPSGAALRQVAVEAGPLQGIDPDALQWAWQCTIADGPFAGARLQLRQLPWQLTCPDCGRVWSSPQMTDPCACGGCRVHPTGGDELRLMSLTVDEAQAAPCPARFAQAGAQ